MLGDWAAHSLSARRSGQKMWMALEGYAHCVEPTPIQTVGPDTIHRDAECAGAKGAYWN
jgi:hypothetical protein